MGRYVLGLLRAAPARPRVPEEEANRLQELHLAHLRRLRESGEVITSGPLEEDTELRGILIFRTDSVARARELMRTDPLVGGGQLLLELYRWYAPAGLGVREPSSPAPELTFETD